jgi:hypothetical protein
MRLLALLVPACAIACSSSQAPATGPTDAGTDVAATPPTLTASARAVPANAIAAIVDAKATPGAMVTVEGDGISTPQLVGADGTVSLAVLGLHPKSTAHLHVRAEKDGLSTAVELSFDAGALPHGLPDAFAPKVTTPGLDGYLFVGIADAKNKIDLDLVLDRNGRIVWYFEPTMYALPGHFQRLGRDFLVSDAAVKGYLQIDSFGKTIATWTTPASEFFDFHEFVELGSGHALMMAFDVEHPYDSTPYVPDGVPTAVRYDGTVDEVDAAGKTYFHFSTYGKIGPEEMIEDGSGWTKIDPAETDLVHLNSIDVAPSGDLLVSMRMTSSVIEVSRADGSIRFRLGGNKSDFTFVDDPLGGFSMQHDARWTSGGAEIMLLDNGNNHDPHVTRACRYAIDRTAKTAKLVWSYTHDPPLFSPFAGSVRALPNGHLQIAHAAQGLVTEIEPETKKVVWEIEVPGYVIYRALHQPKLEP